ncbi:zinc finger protein 343 [Lontra canadensis]|uniref:zinc finger protein 343 n=1 Tax=Lontra canadensis TaxID=76717 RepID=UPI0013F35BC9|nr:zinc finger protein 343 [Lontra canadensis]
MGEGLLLGFIWRCQCTVLTRPGLPSSTTDWLQGKEGKAQMLVLVTFGGVAVVFTDVEWKRLSSEQRSIYKEVMLENYESLLSLAEPKPEIYPCASCLLAFFCQQVLKPTCASDLLGLMCGVKM